MTNTPYVLLIAPNAPPKNSAEAIQVRRILAELDLCASGRLVTVAATSSAWGRDDPTLALPLTHFDTQVLTLPLHNLFGRVLMSHRMARFHVPDAMVWITPMAGQVVRALKTKPDIIYSRSSPFSAALLARRLKQKLSVPWIMHLSDPWVHNIDKIAHKRDAAYEAQCFREADAIMLTTEGQAEHYRRKYPQAVTKIFVTPNVMDEQVMPQTKAHAALDNKLHLVFAGGLYGKRSPKPLLDAIAILRRTQSEILKQLHIDVYGNAQEDALQLLRSALDVLQYHGPVAFADAYKAQRDADVVLNIEVDTDDPLSKCFLPSKVIDSLALGRPMLSITPEGSETERICNEGYGWAVAPSKPEVLAERIAELVQTLPQLRAAKAKAPPERYRAKTVVEDLLRHMNRLRVQR